MPAAYEILSFDQTASTRATGLYRLGDGTVLAVAAAPPPVGPDAFLRGVDRIEVEATVGGEPAGRMVLDLMPDCDSGFGDGVSVEAGFQRRGVATVMHDHLEAMGYEVLPPILLPDGEAFWEARLAARATGPRP